MGILISSFIGCGKTYLINSQGNKAKIFDAGKELINDEDYDSFVDKVMDIVDEYDIVFIPADEEVLDAFNEKNIDYDLFYPSKERRGEIIENCVRKRENHNTIMMLDRNFDKNIDRFDSIETENCYKHKMPEKGHFIGNDGAIMQYINNLSQKPKANEQKQGVEESPRSKNNNEENES